MKSDILFSEKNGLLAVTVNPEGRLAEMAQRSEDTPRVWLFGQTPVPEMNLLMSGDRVQGSEFLRLLERAGIIVAEAPVYVPFGNPDKHGHDPNIMRREESCLCRSDGPSTYPRLVRHMIALVRGGQVAART